MSEIIYPQGCRSVTEDLDLDELIRRLETLADTLQAMEQLNEGMSQQYIPLALHLAEEHFLMHQSNDVQLLIACCIADVLRVYAPEAPYKDAEQVKTIFLLLIKQLAGLKDPKDPAFKRYFYLLENLAYVKSFNMCFELEDCQEIFCALFSLMFKIVNDEHSGEVKSSMLDVLSPLITESDIVSDELLEIILKNIVEPNKTQKKNAYMLAKDLIVKCSDTLKPYIQTFFHLALIILDEEEEETSLQICEKVYDPIYELNHICPTVLLPVLPQLECKLKSSSENKRLGAVALLARMFSEKGSQLAVQHKQLWRAFLGRFNDISVAIRMKCVQYSMHFLLNHPELRKDITYTLKLRQYDPDENVRCEVVMAIVITARRDFEVVSDSEDLLEFVKVRTLDKKFKIRGEAMYGLAMIYKKYLNDADVPQATKKAVIWIKDKILHSYYMASMEDKLLVERLLNTCLVPYQLQAEERMKKLYHLFGTIDDRASKAFVEIQKQQFVVRRTVAQWIDIVKKPDAKNELTAKILQISHFLPDPINVQKFLQQFSSHMKKDTRLLQKMETIVQSNISCKECAETIPKVLEKLGQPVMTNLYYNTIKMLLERVSSVMIDAEAIRVLIGYVLDCLKGGNVIEEIGLNPNNAGEKGLQLLKTLSFAFGPHFLHNDILTQLINLLELKDEMVAPLVLCMFTFLGKYKPLCDVPDIMNLMIPMCKNFAETGTPKQAKQAIRCLFVNMTNIHDTIFPEIIERIENTLTPTSIYYRTSIVTLGHIAYCLADKYQVQMKNMVSEKIVKELLSKGSSEQTSETIEGDWCREDQLPEETRCRLEGLKCVARWLLGSKTDVLSAQKAFGMLNAFIVNKGDLLSQGRLSKAEMSWLRMQAGCSMLKICRQKGVGDQYTAEQFYNLSQLMVDEIPQVREAFGSKLHKGLGTGIPNKCLPLDFMGYYALAGKEQDKRLKRVFKTYMQRDINKRRDYLKTSSLSNVERAMVQLPQILPDYMLVFAVSLLAHDPEFTSHIMITQLEVIQQCLWFILEPLITNNEYYCYGFYKNLVERMKSHKDALKPENNEMNYKLWAVCDLAMNVIFTKTTNFDMKGFSSETRIPTMYFKRSDEALHNQKSYLPAKLQLNMTGAKGKGSFHNTHTGNERPQRKDKSKRQKEITLHVTNTIAEISDTLRENNPNATRCLLAIGLANKCMALAFRTHVRAHGTVAKFFKALHDATENQSLCLCTATVMFVLSQDRLAMDHDRDRLELTLSLLESDARYKDVLDDGGLSHAELLKYKEKVCQLWADIQAQGHAKHLNLDNITLAMETLLSLTSKRAGEWIKEELRGLGGLEYIVETIRECHRHINGQNVSRSGWTDPLLDKLSKVDRCLRVLENVTHMNEENQVYLLKYEDGVLVSTLASLYRLCGQEIPIYPTTDPSDESSTGAVVRECLFAIIKVLIELTDGLNGQFFGSESVGAQAGVLDCSLFLILRVAESLPEEMRFDMMTALNLLINLVEQCDDNKQLLIDSKAPPLSENIFDAEESGVASLINLFCKQEELARAEEQKRDAILDRMKDFEQTETVLTTTKSQEEFIGETGTKLLQTAQKHMEHTLIGAYVVLLLGYLIMDNKEYESLVGNKLPDKNFATMVSVLQKFFKFKHLTALNEASSRGIEKVIKFLKMLDARIEEEKNELPLPALEDQPTRCVT